MDLSKTDLFFLKSHHYVGFHEMHKEALLWTLKEKYFVVTCFSLYAKNGLQEHGSTMYFGHDNINYHIYLVLDDTTLPVEVEIWCGGSQSIWNLQGGFLESRSFSVHNGSYSFGLLASLQSLRIPFYSFS